MAGPNDYPVRDGNGNVIADGSNGGSQAVNAASSAETAGVLSQANSSVVLLAPAGVFTGAWIDVSAYGSIVVNAFASHASATNGLAIQQSSDGINADVTDTYTVAAGTAAKLIIPRFAKYARVVYTNGGTLQTSFRLQTLLDPRMPRGTAQKPADAMSVENDYDMTLSAQMVFNGATLDILREVANGANTVGTGIPAAGLMAQFDDAAVQAITENSFGNLRMSADHVLYTAKVPTASAGPGVVPVKTAVAAGSLIAKAAPGNLYAVNVKTPTGATAMQLMLIDATTAPADGAVTPLKVWDVPAAGTFDRAFDPPIRCGTGIVLVLSTTGPFAKTIALTTNLGFISADVA